MSDDEARDGAGEHDRCVFAWCTTVHGATSHDADEDHRSDGRSVTLALRDGYDETRVSTVEIEVGLLRRRADTRTWLVIEDGRDIRVQVAAESVRELLRAVHADPAVAGELAFRAAGG